MPVDGRLSELHVLGFILLSIDLTLILHFGFRRLLLENDVQLTGIVGGVTRL